MADRNLTLKEFYELSQQERGERYNELSDQDKFRVRMSTGLGKTEAPCNMCRYYHRDASCDAFPGGIDGEHIRKLIEEPTIPCNGALHFVKEEIY